MVGSMLQLPLCSSVSVCVTVLSSDAEDLLEASLMEGFQASEMVAVNGPCLTHIQQCGDTYCSVNKHFGMEIEVVVLK